METSSTAACIDQFGKHLHLFMWAEVKDSSMVKELGNTDNFANKWDEAAGSYIKWLKDGYPRVKPDNQETQRTQHLANLYNIFTKHCPDHPIFEFIDEE